MKKTKLKSTVIIISIMLFASKAYSLSENFEDMVYVSAPSPFYMKIFETSHNDLSKKQKDSKPARINFKQSKDYCKSIGLSLPTIAQWLMAASNLNKNIHYSLIEDTIEGEDNILKANLRRKIGGSSFTKDFKNTGIDSIGTTGMTGNRPEWVLGPEKTSYLCGASYKTEDLNDAHLTRICRNIQTTDLKTNGTARCVLEFDSAIDITFSKHISGELRTYLEKIDYGFKNKKMGNMVSMSIGSPTSMNMTMDKLKIDDNEEDFN